MLNLKKKFTVALSCMVMASVPTYAFIGCDGILTIPTDAEKFKAIEDLLISSVFSNDVLLINEFIADPKGSYGLEEVSDPSWYGYSSVSQSDIDSALYAYKALNSELQEIEVSKLGETDRITYRTVEDMIQSEILYLGSKYASDFMLFGGSYISSDGGYVSLFGTAFENYTFRNEADIKYLVSVTQSTKDAFGTYLDYAGDRASAGYPLYDYTVTGMQDYLDEVYDQGDKYYLYELSRNKVDAAEFLTDAQKTQYKQALDSALDEFMSGVKTLSTGLNLYKGKTPETMQSYLAEYGSKGKAYYEFMFANATGIYDIDIDKATVELYRFYSDCVERCQSIIERVETYEQSDRELYDEFYEYYNAETEYLGLIEPYDILDYLKEAAKSIVPDLTSSPEIDFKYMDETAGKISTTLAYYYFTPIDDKNAHEYITLNNAQIEENDTGLLTLLAHEGYPGHLYAYARAKEKDLSLLTVSCGHMAYAEGWAQYVEGAVLDYVSSTTDSEAVRLYSEFDKYDSIAGYVSTLLYDIEVNYYGCTADDLVRDGFPEQNVNYMIEVLSENPAMYVAYGYGRYYMEYLHDLAKSELGSKYDEVQFNDALLSEGDRNSLARGKELALEYIASKK